ncbi:MAG TPA: SDR family NAD(P)-dependent oxidoreductase [Tepidisphaeraceae bacterium]|nr:SDR family NAD(P)-dependent oxidoreductase [Tepidisphaeraceae bacterium]
MIDLTGKHIFIAGGSRGIGRANALMAARAGADLTVNFVRDQAAADQVVAGIRALGRKAFAIQADLAKDGEADRAMKESVAANGPLHGLAVSAGIFEGSPIDQMSAEFWDRTMSINLRATFLAVRAAISHLRNSRGGSIVIYTSTAGQRGSSVYSAYATSKGAQLLFMRSMAKELAPDRIRVNCVAPGWTETDMSRAAMDAEGREGIIASIPLGRIGKPEDPAAASCFLLSDLAEFITGSTITVDGGFDMRG